MRAGIQRLMKATYGAVAPTVALALFALIGMGGIAFDYAHLAATLPAGVRLLRADHRALVAVQGPLAAEAVGRHAPPR